MDIGKIKTIRINVPGARPVPMQQPKPKETSIQVPNWPTKKPMPVSKPK